MNPKSTTRQIEFQSGSGESVRGVLYEPSTPAPHPAIVFLHGLLSTHQEFGDYPARFCAQGYLALAIDLRGHGTSDGMRGFITEDRMVEDAIRAIDFLQIQPGLDPNRIVLFGHSLGGAAAVCTAARDTRVAAIVAGATIARLRDVLGRFEYLLYRIVDLVNRVQRPITLKSLYMPYRVTYKDLFADPLAVERAQAKGFLQRSVPADNIPPLLKQDAAACARHVHVPALVVIGELDRVVARAFSHQTYEALAGEKEWYVIEGSGHSFATDCMQNVAFDRIANWIDRHLNREQ